MTTPISRAIETILEYQRQLKTAEAENARMREALTRLRECDWLITFTDKNGDISVGDIARRALGEK
jgi:hypothetical protein